MAIQPHSSKEEQKIISDCVKAAKDITTMTNKAYEFLYSASGFMDHYDKNGFMEHYETPGSLKSDILTYQRNNQWGHFHTNDDNYDYYMQKKKIYNAICDCLKNDIEYKHKQKDTKNVEFDFGR
jgi:hypothetical protein